MLHSNLDYGKFGCFPRTNLEKDIALEFPVPKLGRQESAAAGPGMLHVRCLILYRKKAFFFQNIGHWMQTSTGRVWMDYIHFKILDRCFLFN